MPRYCGCCFRQGHAKENCQIKHPNLHKDGMTQQRSRPKHLQPSGRDPLVGDVGPGEDVGGNGLRGPGPVLGVLLVAVGWTGPGGEGDAGRKRESIGNREQQEEQSEGNAGGDGDVGGEGEAGSDGDAGGEGKAGGEGVTGGEKEAGSKKDAVGEEAAGGEGNAGGEGDASLPSVSGGNEE